MPYTITRFKSDANGTFGKFLDLQGQVLAYTCERPWAGNAVGISDIPAGSYAVIGHNSPEHPHTWEITGVPGRSNILIHNGNTEKDSEGCILVGDSFGVVDGLPAVLNSVNTLNKLRSELPSGFTLVITDDYLDS